MSLINPLSNYYNYCSQLRFFSGFWLVQIVRELNLTSLIYSNLTAAVFVMLPVVLMYLSSLSDFPSAYGSVEAAFIANKRLIVIVQCFFMGGNFSMLETEQVVIELEAGDCL